jgi:hypothetical protein
MLKADKVLSDVIEKTILPQAIVEVDGCWIQR